MVGCDEGVTRSALVQDMHRLGNGTVRQCWEGFGDQIKMMDDVHGICYDGSTLAAPRPSGGNISLLKSVVVLHLANVGPVSGRLSGQAKLDSTC